jgi:hypothetical protein
VLRGWIRALSGTRVLYTDGNNVYVRSPNAQERMRGEVPVTQFGRMCAPFGMRIIAASSPQAKGHVERAHGTHQDRLVKKFRLAGIANYDLANAYLDKHYLGEHNRRYARPTARQLDQMFWLEEERVVSEDWVVLYNHRRLQLERQSQHWAPAKSRVLARENEASKIAIHYRVSCSENSRRLLKR